VGALVLYDITKPQSFENLDKWISELKEHADPSVCIMIVGNKTDLKTQRVVSSEDGRTLAGNGLYKEHADPSVC
jgi:Ras-related protein Rab-11A